MARRTLAGRLILIAEDEALISMEMESSFKAAGARVRICTTVADAMVVAADPDLVAAVVNHVLEDGETSPSVRAPHGARHSIRALQWIRKCRGSVSRRCSGLQADNRANSPGHSRGIVCASSCTRPETVPVNQSITV